MALVTCDECGREVSDKAAACINCGAPISASAEGDAPEKVSFQNGRFNATKAQIEAHAVKAIQSLNYKVDGVDSASGLVKFTTGMTWGSWSGVSGSVYLLQDEPNWFTVSGTAKQNVRGGQIVAIDLFGESNGKVKNVIDRMVEMTRL